MSNYKFRDTDDYVKEEWLMENEASCKMIEDKLVAYDKSLILETERARVHGIDWYKLAGDIAFHLTGQMENGVMMPIQSLMGVFVSYITSTVDPMEKIKAFQTAGEIIFCLSPYVMMETTMNGHLRVCTTVSNSDIYFKYLYPLPKKEPSEQHKTLGKYKWTLTHQTELDLLNELPMTVLDIPEQEPSDTKSENHQKWLVRKFFREDFAKSEMFFDWHSCYRGRMYTGGYHFNPQGNEYEKSIITMAKFEELTHAGRQNLKKAMANAWGHGIERGNDFNKLLWFSKQYDEEVLHMYETYKEPHTARRLDMAFEDYKMDGKTNIAIELDATNSQLQCVAVLTGDRTTAEACNVLFNKQPQDAYFNLAEEMSDYMAAVRKR